MIFVLRNARRDLPASWPAKWHRRGPRPLRFVVVDDLRIGRAAIIHCEDLLSREAQVLDFAIQVDEDVPVRTSLLRCYKYGIQALSGEKPS